MASGANPHTRCPGCHEPMSADRFERVTGGQLQIDICYACCVIWFDHTESLQLAPGGVIGLFQAVYEHHANVRNTLPQQLPCPRCRQPLRLTHDLVKTGRVSYYRCNQQHGRLSTFLHFLREKKFVRDLNAGEIATVRAQLGEVRCSGCGAPVNIQTQTVCDYCRAPLSVLDAHAVEKALKHYAGEHRRRNDPAHIAAALGEALITQPLQARARERATAQPHPLLANVDNNWAAGDLVLSGISALMRSLAK